jgi:hypothetical protein
VGITAEFKQVSPYLLQSLKEYPDFAELFFNAKYLPDSEFWQEVTINPNDPDDVEWFNELSNSAVETLEKLKKEKPHGFENPRLDILSIIFEGKTKCLNIDKTWNRLHFFFTGCEYPVRPDFLVGKNEEDHLPSINAVLGGLEINYSATYNLVRYLTDSEIAQVVEALYTLSHSQIRERLRFKGWEEDKFEYLFNYTYEPLVNYYKDAAERGNAMFLYLT